MAQLPGGGEARPGQLAMATAVARAMNDGKNLVVQAGTGTGKSLGYLVPALLARKTVVVATATKALQDQLAGKDLPFLASHLGQSFEFAVLKGRSNYFCRQRAAEVTGGEQLSIEDGDGEANLGALGRQVKALIEWAEHTETGDRSELSFEPRPRAWSTVSVSAMECPGAVRCPSGDDCFAEAARVRAESADIIVVNTHLYGAHLASGSHVLPEHDVVIFDEAHELEDVAATSLGLELTGGRFRALARTAGPLIAESSLIADLEEAGTRLEEALVPSLGQRLPRALDAELRAAVDLAATRVNRLASALRTKETTEHAGRKARALQAAGHLEGDLKFLIELPESHVAWVEGLAHAPSLQIAAVDVAGVLGAKLWGIVPAVLTSATIPAGIVTRLGLDPESTDEMNVGSPFDFEHNALLYCAAHLPDPRRREEFEVAMHDELAQLLEAARGRALCLFTSWRAMTAAAEVLKDRVSYTVHTQSDLPKPALVAAFTEEESSCLFATMGFWQGVDVPGPSLSLVTIDRVPFPRPDEPLMQARRDRAGRGAFGLIDLPRAAMLLAQGTGRLIRSATDRGVVAVLDPRLASANYRWDLVNALPPMRRTKDMAEVRAFFAPGAQ